MSDESPSTLRPGQTFTHHGKKYKILKQIWFGPFSEVMIVKEINGNERYAMKIEKTNDPQ
ncbi:hypothetical protein WUBG_15574, partial [Wuchereria bancrofti]